MKRNIIHLPINNSIIKYINNKRAPFQSFSHASIQLSLSPSFHIHPPLSPIRPTFAKYAYTRRFNLTRECFDSIFAQRSGLPPPPFYCIVNNPSVKKRGWTKGMDVCTCFHGQRNDENHELGDRSTLHASSPVSPSPSPFLAS